MLDCPALSIVLLHAVGDKFFDFHRPLAGELRGLLFDYSVEQGILATLLENVLVRWITRQQLICEAPIGPDVDLFRVGFTVGDFGGEPGWRALLAVPILTLLRQEDTEAHVSNFERSIGAYKNIV